MSTRFKFYQHCNYRCPSTNGAKPSAGTMWTKRFNVFPSKIFWLSVISLFFLKPITKIDLNKSTAIQNKERYLCSFPGIYCRINGTYGTFPCYILSLVWYRSIFFHIHRKLKCHFHETLVTGCAENCHLTTFSTVNFMKMTFQFRCPSRLLQWCWGS